MPTYQVTGPLAVAKDTAGKIHYYYHGAVLPDGTPDAEIEKLKGRALITAVGVEIAPDTPDTHTVERPTLVAPKESWVDYVVARGMARDKAEASSKRDLIDAYPPPE